MDPLGRAAFRHAAEHPVPFLLGLRAEVAVPEGDSEAEPDSDSLPRPPDDFKSPTLFQTCAPPGDQSKLFWLGCTPAGTY
jgi:hypothetical protein